MKKASNCLMCDSKNLDILKRYVFRFPGNNVENHLEDIIYTRLWILFKKIIKDQNNVTFDSVICNSCGHIFLNPIFSEKDIKIKYDVINELGSVKYRIKNKPPVNVEKRSKRIYELIKSYYYFSIKDNPKILDYGGAEGDILRPFTSDFKCRIIDYEHWDLPNGIKYLGKDLSDLRKNDKFDVILLLHTLEHIVHPKEFITKICSHLDNDGIIYVEVPLGCFQEWKYLAEPLTHINFFSEESLSNCFKITGLNIIHLRTSFQQVTTTKKWCVNIIGTKLKSRETVQSSKIQSTSQQMSKIIYYIPYFFKVKAIERLIKMHV